MFFCKLGQMSMDPKQKQQFFIFHAKWRKTLIIPSRVCQRWSLTETPEPSAHTLLWSRNTSTCMDTEDGGREDMLMVTDHFAKVSIWLPVQKLANCARNCWMSQVLSWWVDTRPRTPCGTVQIQRYCIGSKWIRTVTRYVSVNFSVNESEQLIVFVFVLKQIDDLPKVVQPRLSFGVRWDPASLWTWIEHRWRDGWILVFMPAA